MREHVLLFCLLGLVLTATIILAIAPGAVTWALSLIDWADAGARFGGGAAPNTDETQRKPRACRGFQV